MAPLGGIRIAALTCRVICLHCWSTTFWWGESGAVVPLLTSASHFSARPYHIWEGGIFTIFRYFGHFSHGSIFIIFGHFGHFRTMVLFVISGIVAVFRLRYFCYFQPFWPFSEGALLLPPPLGNPPMPAPTCVTQSLSQDPEVWTVLTANNVGDVTQREGDPDHQVLCTTTPSMHSPIPQISGEQHSQACCLLGEGKNGLALWQGRPAPCRTRGAPPRATRYLRDEYVPLGVLLFLWGRGEVAQAILYPLSLPACGFTGTLVPWTILLMGFGPGTSSSSARRMTAELRAL